MPGIRYVGDKYTVFLKFIVVRTACWTHICQDGKEPECCEGEPNLNLEKVREGLQ